MRKSRYDSWVRCLTNWEGKKNICPLTKKPLTKRDLGKKGNYVEIGRNMLKNLLFPFTIVILTHDNIEEYRDKIIQ